MNAPAAPSGALARDLAFRAVLGVRPVEVRELATTEPTATVVLRRYPFPWRAALAIANDPRGADPALFLAMHRAFAERGLEVAAAASWGEVDPCAVGTPLAARLHAAGLLDAVACLPPEGAAVAAVRLAAAGLAPACYFGGAPVAAAAPLASAGVRFFTDAGFAARGKFGEGRRFRATGELRQAFAAFDFGRLGRDDGEGATALEPLLAAVPAEHRRGFLLAVFNDPLLTIEAGGSPIAVFKRYAGPQRPCAATLPLQLRSQFLDALEAGGGIAIVEQRLGEDALIGMPAARERRRPADASSLDIHHTVALDELAERAASAILVAGTGRLLDWLDRRRRTELTVEEAPGRWLVRVTGARPGEGFALTVPASAPEVTVIAAGSANPLVLRRVADPHLPGHDCLHLPWGRREWPVP